MANKHSEYLVAIPKKAATNIQNKAPGPPMCTAVATPTILPVPMVLAKAVHKAAKPVISPCLDSSDSLDFLNTSFKENTKLDTWISLNL